MNRFLSSLQEFAALPWPGQVQICALQTRAATAAQRRAPQLCSFWELNYPSHQSKYRLISFILKRQIDPSALWVSLQTSHLGLPRHTGNGQKPIDQSTLSCLGSCGGLSGLKTVCPGISGTLISDQIISISFPLLVTVWLQLTRLQSPKAVTDIWIKILQDF